MASSRTPLAELPLLDEIEDLALAWHGLMDAASGGDLQAAMFLQKFAPWAREQLERWERA